MKVKVQTLDAKASGDIELNDGVFAVEPRADILHRVVTWQLEKRRATARGTRERADVARSGKKFGRQKGGGTARHGDRRAPVFIGGGKAHGARVRDFNPSLNKKIRALGLKMALSSHAKAGSLIVVDAFSTAKTAELKAQFAKLGTGKTALVIDGEAGNGFLAARNLIGGGKAHGARVRDFNPSLNKKIRALGLKMALSSHAKAGSLIVVDAFSTAKTAELKAQFAKLGTGKTALVIDGEAGNGFLAARNLIGVNVLPAVGANVYDILKHDTLVLTRAAVEKLEARFNG